MKKRARSQRRGRETLSVEQGARTIVRTSLYLPPAVHDALRSVAFKERVKVHDLILEGIELALRKRVKSRGRQ